MNSSTELAHQTPPQPDYKEIISSRSLLQCTQSTRDVAREFSASMARIMGMSKNVEDDDIYTIQDLLEALQPKIAFATAKLENLQNTDLTKLGNQELLNLIFDLCDIPDEIATLLQDAIKRLKYRNSLNPKSELNSPRSAMIGKISPILESIQYNFEYLKDAYNEIVKMPSSFGMTKETAQTIQEPSFSHAELVTSLRKALARELVDLPAEATYQGLNSRSGVRLLRNVKDTPQDSKSYLPHLADTYMSIFVTSILSAQEAASLSGVVHLQGFGLATTSVMDVVETYPFPFKQEEIISDSQLIEWIKATLEKIVLTKQSFLSIRKFIAVDNLPSKPDSFIGSFLMGDEGGIMLNSLPGVYKQGLERDSYLHKRRFSQESQSFSQKECQKAIIDGTIQYLDDAQKMDEKGWAITDKPGDIVGVFSVTEDNHLTCKIVNPDIGSYRPKVSRQNQLRQAYPHEALNSSKKIFRINDLQGNDQVLPDNFTTRYDGVVRYTGIDTNYRANVPIPEIIAHLQTIRNGLGT